MSSTDRDIPDRVVAFFEGGGRARPRLRRVLTIQERQSVSARVADLEAGLEPHPPAARRHLGAAIAAMLNGFNQMKRMGDAEAADVTAAYLSVMRERPAWAIVKVCADIQAGKEKTCLDFPPSEARINQIVGDVLVPYRARLIELNALIRAEVHR